MAYLNFDSESCQHGHQKYPAGPSLTCDTTMLWKGLQGETNKPTNQTTQTLAITEIHLLCSNTHIYLQRSIKLSMEKLGVGL